VLLSKINTLWLLLLNYYYYSVFSKILYYIYTYIYIYIYIFNIIITNILYIIFLKKKIINKIIFYENHNP